MSLPVSTGHIQLPSICPALSFIFHSVAGTMKLSEPLPLPIQYTLTSSPWYSQAVWIPVVMQRVADADLSSFEPFWAAVHPVGDFYHRHSIDLPEIQSPPWAVGPSCFCARGATQCIRVFVVVNGSVGRRIFHVAGLRRISQRSQIHCRTKDIALIDKS